jgi:ParB family chromosome partitioning protein
VTQHSGQIEWYTPTEYLETARRVLGTIDLDPASCLDANAVVQASRFYTAEDDGLQYRWSGRVWLNPPYRVRLVQLFTQKLVRHVVAGDIDAAIVLTNNATDTRWFRVMADVASAICFKTGRISFWSSGRSSKTPLQGQAFVYFGKDVDVFVREFRTFGWFRL